jgi:cytochrome oxidase Cu insertion factor (SCO1/SenC/PrrC family)
LQIGKPAKNMTRRKKRNFLTLIAICTALTLFAILGIVQSQKASQSIAFAEDLPNSREGLPTIGGPFELVDYTGKSWKDTDFKGKPFLIYFGYTYCPDICPTALYNMTQALEKLGGAKIVQPVFITVDPERDTASQLQLYSQNFHKDFVMLTGTKAQIDQAVGAYRAHAARASQERGKDDYLIDHSSIIYLMDKNGQFVTHFNHQTQPEEIVERVKVHAGTGK